VELQVFGVPVVQCWVKMRDVCTPAENAGTGGQGILDEIGAWTANGEVHKGTKWFVDRKAGQQPQSNSKAQCFCRQSAYDTYCNGGTPMPAGQQSATFRWQVDEPVDLCNGADQYVFVPSADNSLDNCNGDGQSAPTWVTSRSECQQAGLTLGVPTLSTVSKNWGNRPRNCGTWEGNTYLHYNAQTSGTPTSSSDTVPANAPAETDTFDIQTTCNPTWGTCICKCATTTTSTTTRLLPSRRLDVRTTCTEGMGTLRVENLRKPEGISLIECDYKCRVLNPTTAEGVRAEFAYGCEKGSFKMVCVCVKSGSSCIKASTETGPLNMNTYRVSADGSIPPAQKTVLPPQSQLMCVGWATSAAVGWRYKTLNARTCGENGWTHSKLYYVFDGPSGDVLKPFCWGHTVHSSGQWIYHIKEGKTCGTASDANGAEKHDGTFWAFDQMATYTSPYCVSYSTRTDQPKRWRIVGGNSADGTCAAAPDNWQHSFQFFAEPVGVP